MGINIEQYKLIYKDVVYNPLEIIPAVEWEAGYPVIKCIELFYINEDGELRLLQDEVQMFKFVRR